MLTPVELIIFACVVACCMAVGIAWQRSAAAAGSNVVNKLQWLPELERRPQGGQISSTEELDIWLHRVVSQSRIGLSLPTFLLAASCGAILAGVAVRLLGMAEPFQILAAVTVFAASVIAVWIMFRRQRRQFNEQFPLALELMSRAVQAGESFEDAVRVAQSSSQAPMKDELERCLRQMEMGIGVAASLNLLATRVPTMDVKIFTHTIAVHREMGGRLAETLQRLATVIRERADYTEKLRSATSMGRFAAVMIGVIGVLALAYLLLCQPDYIGKLLASPLGQRMAIYAAVSEIVGIVWVCLTLKSEF